MKNKKRFFNDASTEYKWAAKQGYDQWVLFTHKPTWDKKERRWFDDKDRYHQRSFFPSDAPEVESENSLIRRYSVFRCC